MSTPAEVASGRPGDPERRLFMWGALGVALLVLVGFAPTYYLKTFFGTPALPWWVHLHGLVMSTWFVLLILQTALIAARRVDWHRRLGMFGAVLALVLVLSLSVVSIHSVRLGHTPGPPPGVMLGVNFAPILLFAGFVASGLLRRARPDYHKRLMLLASLSLLPSAIVRMPLAFIQAGGPFAVFGATDACVLACLLIDTLRRRRLHPAFGWGALLIAAVFPLFLILAQTPQWLRFATWMGAPLEAS
jgi:hypothetical protein